MRPLHIIAFLPALFASSALAQPTDTERARNHCSGSDNYRAAYDCDCVAKKFEAAWTERGTRGWETIYNSVFTDARECAVPKQIEQAAQAYCLEQYSSLFYLFDTAKLGAAKYCPCVGTESAKLAATIEPVYIYQLPKVHKLARDACTK